VHKLYLAQKFRHNIKDFCGNIFLKKSIAKIFLVLAILPDLLLALYSIICILYVFKKNGMNMKIREKFNENMLNL